METSLPKFSRAAQKILVAQNLGGAAAPLAPPARTPMIMKEPNKGVNERRARSKYLTILTICLSR